MHIDAKILHKIIMILVQHSTKRQNIIIRMFCPRYTSLFNIIISTTILMILKIVQSIQKTVEKATYTF